jgi:predicted tellurium resistance membrane protein TerC
MLSFFIGLTAPLFVVAGHDVSLRSLILFIGGAFLIYKATHEIHNYVVHDSDQAKNGSASSKGGGPSFWGVLGQILLVDLVFSFDSVITAVGVAKAQSVMVVSIIVAVAVMLAFSGVIVRFIHTYPTLKMLALSFILLIGVLLTMEGAGKEIERSYIYFAMAFSLAVEVANISRARIVKSSRPEDEDVG